MNDGRRQKTQVIRRYQAFGKGLSERVMGILPIKPLEKGLSEKC
jgi:hypothetical protein